MLKGKVDCNGYMRMNLQKNLDEKLVKKVCSYKYGEKSTDKSVLYITKDKDWFIVDSWGDFDFSIINVPVMPFTEDNSKDFLMEHNNSLNIMKEYFPDYYNEITKEDSE